MRNILKLNGIWELGFADAMPEGRRLAPDVKYTEPAVVPGCFDVVVPHFGKRTVAVYRRKVSAGGKVKLNIDGVGLAAKVYWDGKLIGKCPYAYMPESFIFNAGKRGEHELVIAVDNNFNNICFCFYDFYLYGGIYGDVTLEELPQDEFIRDWKISTVDYRCGKMKLDITTELSRSGKVSVAFDNGKYMEFPAPGGRAELELNVPDFKLWSPDEPHLHNLKIAAGNDEVSGYFGIREIKAEGTKLFLNGKELFLMGYNRHESHPQHGAAMPGNLIYADLKLIKEQGCNFIRGSHYPQRRTTLELCDRLGLLVWEETLGWDVKPPEIFRPRFLKQQIDQIHKLCSASFNHPCIIIRGFLNETESQLSRMRPIIAKLIQECKAADPTRLVSYSSNKYERDICMDLVDIVAMNPYPGWVHIGKDHIKDIDVIRPTLDRLKQAIPADKPYMLSEIGAGAQYGFRDPYGARWSEEYQAELLTEVCDIVFNDPRYCGLCIWQYCNAKSYLSGTRPNGFNDKGVRDEFRRPKLAWDAVSKCIKELGR